MDGLTVLVEAKKEYLAQLCCVMCPHMIETFENMYTEAGKISKGKQVLQQYQKLLKEVPNWNNHIIHQHADKMNSTCSWFNDLLAAVFVSYVKILSSVRINSENKKISLKLPSNEVFIHGCFTCAAKELYKDPYVYHDEMTEYERDANLTRRFITCIETTVKDMIPIQEILKAYISNKSEIEFENKPAEDTEDPDIEESFPEEEPLPLAEGKVSAEGAPEGDPSAAVPPVDPTSQPVPAPISGPGGAINASEVKTVNVANNNNNNDEDVLFPDAN
jgi:hypothetical protein